MKYILSRDHRRSLIKQTSSWWRGLSDGEKSRLVDEAQSAFRAYHNRMDLTVNQLHTIGMFGMASLLEQDRCGLEDQSTHRDSANNGGQP